MADLAIFLMNQNDTWEQLIAIGVREAAERLNELTDYPISVQVPMLEIIQAVELPQKLQGYFGSEPVGAAHLPFSGELAGIAQLLFSQQSAVELTVALTEEEPGTPEFAQLKVEALTEVGNIVLNSVIGALSNQLNQNLTFSVPAYLEDTIEKLLLIYKFEPEATVLLSNAQFSIEELSITGEIIIFFEADLGVEC